MSSLNFLLQSDLVMVCTDTLALSADSHLPSHFQSKAFPVLHLDGVLCGTGIGQFVVSWYSIVLTSMLSRSIPQLDEYAPSSLRQLAQESMLPDSSSTTIYHFGYDPDALRYRGYAYRSEQEFNSEELPFGFGIKPQTQFEPSDNPLEDFIRLVAIQREEDSSRPISERIGIGGDIHVLFLEPGAITMRKVHRFDDYNSLYDDMCTRLPRSSSMQ